MGGWGCGLCPPCPMADQPRDVAAPVHLPAKVSQPSPPPSPDLGPCPSPRAEGLGVWPSDVWVPPPQVCW